MLIESETMDAWIQRAVPPRDSRFLSRKSELLTNLHPKSKSGQGPPPIGIAHLMLWMLCSAVYVAATRANHALQTFEVSEQQQVLQRATDVAQGVIMGATCAGAITLLRWRYRVGGVAPNPGHSILLIHLALNLMLVPVPLLVHFGGFESIAAMYLMGAVFLFEAAAYTLAACNYGPFRWRFFFALTACLSVGQGCGLLILGMQFAPFFWLQTLLDIPTWARVLVVVVGLITCAQDAAAGERRDWLHFVGVAAH